MKQVTPNPALLPSYETLLRGHAAFTEWWRVMVTIKNSRKALDWRADKDEQMSDGFVALSNHLAQSELSAAEKINNIVEVCRQIVAEADNAELINACNCLNRERNIAEAAADAAIGNGECWNAAKERTI
jgi:hypothetical protein